MGFRPSKGRTRLAFTRRIPGLRARPGAPFAYPGPSGAFKFFSMLFSRAAPTGADEGLVAKSVPQGRLEVMTAGNLSAIENSRTAPRIQDRVSILFSRPYGTFRWCMTTQYCVLG